MMEAAKEEEEEEEEEEGEGEGEEEERGRREVEREQEVEMREGRRKRRRAVSQVCHRLRNREETLVNCLGLYNYIINIIIIRSIFNSYNVMYSNYFNLRMDSFHTIIEKNY